MTEHMNDQPTEEIEPREIILGYLERCSERIQQSTVSEITEALWQEADNLLDELNNLDGNAKIK